MKQRLRKDPARTPAARMPRDRRSARWILLGVAPFAVAATVFACGDDEPRRVEAPDAESDAPPGPIDTGAAPDDAGVDVRVPVDASDEAVTCAAKPCVIQLAAGDEHFCALLDDGTVRCWGSPIPALGPDAGTTPSRPIAMGVTEVEQISAGQYVTCARRKDSTVQCWGGNFSNELGLDPPGPDFEPHDPTTVAVDGGALTGFERVDVGRSSAVYAVKTTGELWSWGSNSKLALARPRTVDNWGASWLGPGPITYAPDASFVAAGGVSFLGGAGSLAFAITRDRRLLMWGTGTPTVAYPGPVPVPVEGLEDVGNAAVTQTNICAVAGGQLYCWGESGRLACTGSPHPATAPVAIRPHGHGAAQQVSLGLSNTCVRLNDGTIECCGDDQRGQLGLGDVDDGGERSDGAWLLTPVSALTGRAVHVAVGASSVCALMQGGTVRCWGSNELGQLGQGTTDVQRHPTPVTVTFD